MKTGEKFNESNKFADQVTAKLTKKLTSRGLYNQTPTYHYNSAFTADSKYLVLATAREG